MAIKKSELYSKLWKSCDALRGGMDASQYKDYILVLLFVKYVSDKYEKKGLIKIPEKGGFQDMVKLIGNEEIGTEINKIIKKLAKANDLMGIINTADFNDEAKLGKGKAKQERLSSLVGIFDDLDLSKNRADGVDLLGDAYEYLMRKFATQSGKSKGQFYTPSEVSQVIAEILGTHNAIRSQSVYDPTCGSGSLLLKVAHETSNGITIYGQEIESATRTMAKMNMILHKNTVDAEIEVGDTISDPQFKEGIKLKEFDFAVSNPPFSTKEWSDGITSENDTYKRFDDFDLPPPKNGDYA